MDVTPIIVDIETTGLPNAADFLEPVTPDARLKDPARIVEDIKAKEEARINKLALDWNVGRIVALAWWTAETGTVISCCQSEDMERAALKAFWDESRHRPIIGFNVKGFDLRFMVQRSRYLRLPHPQLDFSKYSKRGVIDLFLELTFGDGTYDQGAMRRTLKQFCRRFGMPVEDTVSGAEVPALVAAGQWDQVAAHVKSDVELTAELARLLGFVQTSVAEAAQAVA